jgi:type IV pilus assembly protein PilA
MFKALKKKMKDQRGLTLIELLAVVVILGIIAAIAVPSIGKLIDNTKEDAVVAEAVQIINGAKLYVIQEIKTPATVELTETQIGGYVDNVKSANTGYTVTATYSSGKYTYSIKNHPSVQIITPTAAAGTSVLESALLAH